MISLHDDHLSILDDNCRAAEDECFSVGIDDRCARGSELSDHIRPRRADEGLTAGLPDTLSRSEIRRWHAARKPSVARVEQAGYRITAPWSYYRYARGGDRVSGKGAPNNSANLWADENNLSLPRDLVAASRLPASASSSLIAPHDDLTASPPRQTASPYDLALRGKSRWRNDKAKRLGRHKWLTHLSRRNWRNNRAPCPRGQANSETGLLGRQTHR